MNIGLEKSLLWFARKWREHVVRYPSPQPSPQGGGSLKGVLASLVAIVLGALATRWPGSVIQIKLHCR
ncbi:hypothetical protein CI41S_78540 [Bradyrhizobium ivorense]|nr:hypothetical protein CI41S_78540 [Bradyrhizobium ivorense]